MSNLTAYGKKKWMGRFQTVSEAKKAYNRKKQSYILDVAASQKDERVKKALVRHANTYKTDESDLLRVMKQKKSIGKHFLSEWEILKIY